jgi:hypothetical protein
VFARLYWHHGSPLWEVMRCQQLYSRAADSCIPHAVKETEFLADESPVEEVQCSCHFKFHQFRTFFLRKTVRACLLISEPLVFGCSKSWPAALDPTNSRPKQLRESLGFSSRSGTFGSRKMMFQKTDHRRRGSVTFEQCLQSFLLMLNHSILFLKAVVRICHTCHDNFFPRPELKTPPRNYGFKYGI